ncbi:separin, partial [Heterodontus francisci]|uniref:separin n=1 Tax=Heterodontus francisci TaxID=7792 RepID=UPI00355AEE31
TLQDALQLWELEPSAMAALLVEELRAYKRLRTDTSQERFNVICDLIKLSSSQEGSEMQHMRAVQLVELAQVLCYRDFSQHAECSAMDCVEEALNVLGSLPETPDNRHQLQDDQAQAFLWLYVCDLESKVRTSVEGCRRAATVPGNLSGLEDGETNDLDYEDRQQGDLSVHDCINFNLTAESQRCKPMDKALSLWKSILSETPVPRLRCSEQTVHSLHLMAVLYRLMDKPFQAIESYSLSLRLLDAQSDSLSVVNVLLQLGEMMLLLDCLGPMQAYLAEAEQLLKTADPSKGDYLLMKMTCSVLRSQLLCASRQVPEGLALLLEVLKCPSLQKSSKVWYLLKAKAQQLVAFYLSLSPSALSAHLRQQLQDQGWRSPESALTDSHKVLCGIVMLMCPGVLMFGKSNPEMSCPVNPGDNLFQKWLVLAHLLTCSRRLVSLLSTMGSAQEAKMFCLETLRLTAKLHCVRPCAEFLVASAELELQRGDPGACNLDLEQVLLLLESCTDFGSEIRVKGGGRIQPRKGRAAERSQEGSREGQREGEETPDFLRFRPLAQVNAVDGGDRWAQTASPVLKPKPRKCPTFLSHTTGCPCPVCSDLPLSAICLRWALARSQLDGVTGESGQLLTTVRERCRAQGARFEAVLQSLALGVLKEAPESDLWAPVSGEDGSQALVAPLRAIIAQTYTQSAWLSLGSDPFAQTWRLLEGGLKWLSCWSPGLQELEHSRAALLLTRASTMIGQLATSHRCSVAGIFPVWGWQHKKTQGGGPGVKGQSSSSLRRAAGGAGRKPGVAAGKTPMGPSIQTPARAGSNKPRAVSRAQRFEVLEEEPTPAWTEQALPAVRVSARVRSRLKKQFDDSDVEEGALEPADGEQHGPAARRGTTKPRRQNRSAAPAPCKVLAQSKRPEEAGRRAKHRSRARRCGEEETERGIEVFCTSDTEQEEPGSRRVAARNVPECEVLRRCDSTQNPKTAIPPVERKGSWPHCEQQQPTVLTSSADVAELDAVISCLSDACSSIRHCPPSALYAQACHLLALCLGLRDPYTTAYLLNESLAITARHQMIQCLHRKSHKNRKERSRDVTERLQELTLSPDTDPQSQYLAELGSLFRFSTTDPARWPQANGEMLKEQLQQVPDGVVICLLTLSAVPLRDTGELLLLSRLEKGRVPVTVQILAEQGRVSVSSLLGEFDAILKQQKEISNVTELKAWWDGRMALDQRMKQVVESLETEILGCWRGLLLPGSLDPRLELEAAALSRFLVDGDCKNVEKELIEGALRASHLLTRQDVRSLADCLCWDSPSEARSQLEGAVHRLKTLTDQSSGQSSQLILILDKHLQRLPWESMPMLRSHRISRLPSFQFLLSYLANRKHQLSSVLTEGVNPNSVFYVLNPQGNLPNTEKTFKDWFRRKDGWDGVVGCGPSEEQLRSMLCNRDLYLYAGHGAGVRFLEGQEIQKLSCRAASLLVGCSSATLALRGNLEGAGIVLKYMMAGCPLFVGNLWDVTDKDIDRYMEYLLRSWLEAGPQASILDYISLARQAPKLKYLIGASPVAYGLSVTLR